MEGITHTELVKRGCRWLTSIGCSVVLSDDMRFHSTTGELPDCVGWRGGISILVEVKTSRSDFLADSKKWFRKDDYSDMGIGDWRFYLCPPEIIQPEDLPIGWGLVWTGQKRMKRVAGVPPNTKWGSDKPFTGNKLNENKMLVSALRRLQ